MASNLIPNARGYRYTPTYAGLPIEEIGQAFNMGAQQSEFNLDNLNKVQMYISQIQTLPGDDEYKRQAAQRASDTLKSIATQSDGTKRYDLATDATRQLAMSVFADPALNAAQQSYKNYEAGELTKQEMRNKGQTPVEFSDPTKFRSVDENGRVQVYRPHIEAKGDYIKEAAQIWNSVAPELISANLTPSEVEGILEGKVIKGITPQMISSALSNVKNTYMSSDTGQQQLRILKKEGVKNAEKGVNDFLLGIGMLKVHADTNVNWQADPEYRYRKEMEKIQLQTAGKLAVKKASGRGDFDENAEVWFSRLRTNATRGKDQKDIAVMIGINSPIMGKALSQTLPLPQKDTYEFVGTDAKNVKKDNIAFEGVPQVIGLVSTNVYGDDYRGGYYANVKYRDGKGEPKTATIVMKSGNDRLRNRMQTVATIEDKIAMTKQKDGFFVQDDSEILGFANNALQEQARQQGYAAFGNSLGFVVKPSGDKKTGEVVPAIKINGERRAKELTPQQASDLGLKQSYSIDDIYKLTQDQLVKEFNPYFQTSKSLQEQAGQ
jgi:hypothetical protein